MLANGPTDEHTVVLIHGAYHGGWCWELLRPQLQSLGLRTVAPTLPCDDPSAGLDAYADCVEEELDPESAVTLVAHSLGALTAQWLAARRSVHTIYLCTLPIAPSLGLSMVPERLTTRYRALDSDTDPAGNTVIRPADATEVFYHDCPAHVVSAALPRLRAQSRSVLAATSELSDRGLRGPIDVVLTREDRAFNTEWAVPASSRLLDGRDPLVLPGGHSPFLSRPRQLAAAIEQLVRRRRASCP